MYPQLKNKAPQLLVMSNKSIKNQNSTKVVNQ